MILEQKQKQELQHQQDQLRKPVFNPFSTVMHSTPMAATPVGESYRMGGASNPLVIGDYSSNIGQFMSNGDQFAGRGSNALFDVGRVVSSSDASRSGGGNALLGTGRETYSSAQHPLFRPQTPTITSNIPIFSMHAAGISSVVATEFVGSYNASKVGAENNSGRSTPSTSGSILRDVLQQ